MRTSSAGARWASVLVMLFLGGYVAAGAFALGALFPVLAGNLAPQTAPAALLNTHLLVGLLGLTGARFFFQPSPRADLRPYLPRPLSHRRLAHLVQGLSALGLFNGLALCFLVPAWLSTVRPAAAPGGGLLWGVGALAVVLATHYAVLPLRILAGWYGRRFWIGAGLVAALLALDQATGPHLVQRLSAGLFGALAQGSATALLAPLGALALTYVVSVRMLLRALCTDPGGGAAHRRSALRRPLAWLARRGPSGALAAVELKLVLRNPRPRVQAVMAGLIGTVYVFIFDAGEVMQAAFFQGFIGVITSGAFVLSYGQFLFCWDAAHLGGVMARTSSLRAVLRAKLHLLQGSCLLLYLLGLPLFLWSAPYVVPVHAVFLLFNVGLLCPAYLAIGLFATKPIDLSKGAFFNYEGTSWLNLVQLVLVFLPPVALMMLPAPYHLWSTAGLGLAGLAATPWWTRALVHLFAKRRHRMLAGFRSS